EPQSGSNSATHLFRLPTQGTIVAVFSGSFGFGIYNVEDWSLTRYVRRRTGGHRSAAMSGDGKILALGSWGGAISLWDIEAFKELEFIKQDDRASTSVRSLAFRPQGDSLAAGVMFGAVGRAEIQIRRSSDLSLVRIQDKNFSDVSRLSYSPNGRFLAAS